MPPKPKREKSNDSISPYVSVGPGKSTTQANTSPDGEKKPKKDSKRKTAAEAVNATQRSSYGDQKTTSQFLSPNSAGPSKSENKDIGKTPSKTPSKTVDVCITQDKDQSVAVESADKEKPKKKKQKGKADEEVKKSTMQQLDPKLTEDNRYKWAKPFLNSDSMKAVTKEFTSFVKGVNKDLISGTCEVFTANSAKNRYRDVRCLDATRVVLKERSEKEDYIHANWITLGDGYKYICTQGPLNETIEDFWHMIYTEQSKVIIMLCSYHESGSEKCAKYCSQKHEMEFGQYKVKMNEIKGDIMDEISYIVYELCKTGGSPMLVHHFSCPKWEDHISPIDPKPYIALLEQAREIAKDSPITVHCSAGIGRTGSFVGIDFARQKINANHKIHMLDIVKELRTMRLQAVQGGLQYVFMHVALLELFAQEGAIPRDENFNAAMNVYTVRLKRISGKLHKDEEKQTEKKAKNGEVRRKKSSTQATQPRTKTVQDEKKK